MEEEAKETTRVEEQQYKPYEVKLPPIGARPGMAEDSEAMARKLQAQFDAESSSEEESEDEEEMQARNRRRSRAK